ncbi:MAG: serine/threonine protein kinase [Myxococcales bacterium]|nr:serine/threonine protein kinase [Myxococcales bacterium]
MDEPSPPTTSPLGEAAPGPKVDRDLMFARVEQRLLGRTLTPVRVGRFVVLRRVGHGGMGVVYAAHDPELDRKVAVKLVDDGGGDGSGPTEAHRELLREARAAAALTHPNVVTVYEVGLEGDAVFLAMEYVDGPTLRRWLEPPGDRRWREVVGMFVAAGRGLAAAHRAGLVHRDFKPDNVLIGADGRPRVADFGLARPAPRDRTEPGDGSEPAGEGTFTSVAGTPRYMAPEQHDGQGIGPASDQFAFCVALYEGLYGQPPFPISSVVDRLDALERPLPAPPSRGVPRSLWRVLRRGLAQEPAQRWPGMAELLEALEAVGRRRRRLATAAVVVPTSSLAQATSTSHDAQAPRHPPAVLIGSSCAPP